MMPQVEGPIHRITKPLPALFQLAAFAQFEVQSPKPLHMSNRSRSNSNSNKQDFLENLFDKGRFLRQHASRNGGL